MTYLKKYRATGRALPGPRDGLMQDIARFPGVQAELEMVRDNIARQAELNLQEVRARGIDSEGESYIYTINKRIDHYVVFADRHAQSSKPKLNTAISIEYGRAGYWDPDTGIMYGASPAHWILHKAADLPRKRPNGLRRTRRLARRGRYMQKRHLQNQLRAIQGGGPD